MSFNGDFFCVNRLNDTVNQTIDTVNQMVDTIYHSEAAIALIRVIR